MILSKRTRRRKRSSAIETEKPRFDVCVYYRGFHMAYDDLIRRIGKEHGGEHIGSGTWLDRSPPSRDHQFSFPTEEKAKKAALALDTLPGIDRVSVQFDAKSIAQFPTPREKRIARRRVIAAVRDVKKVAAVK